MSPFWRLFWETVTMQGMMPFRYLFWTIVGCYVVSMVFVWCAEALRPLLTGHVISKLKDGRYSRRWHRKYMKETRGRITEKQYANKPGVKPMHRSKVTKFRGMKTMFYILSLVAFLGGIYLSYLGLNHWTREFRKEFTILWAVAVLGPLAVIASWFIMQMDLFLPKAAHARGYYRPPRP